LIRKYELVWILGSEATDDDAKASLERVSALVTERGGEVTKAEPWGRRTLSYPIKKNREGVYLIAQFSADSNAAQDLEKAIYSDQLVIRHLLVRDEPKKLEGEDAREKAAAAAQ
jgi:small subunit ribosomal protein S6